MSKMFKVTYSEVESVKKQIKYECSIKMTEGASVREKHKEWFLDRKADLEMRYWNRYKKYLLNKGFSVNVINTMDDVLDKLTDYVKTYKASGLAFLKIDEEITYSNEYNNYYIFTTKSRVVVLNNEYVEILNESIATIKNRNDNQELIYKTNKLMFEETKLKKENLIYRYYDASNGEFIKETIMEKK